MAGAVSVIPWKDPFSGSGAAIWWMWGSGCLTPHLRALDASHAQWSPKHLRDGVAVTIGWAPLCESTSYSVKQRVEC